MEIISKVGEYLVEPTINQARYLFCFNSIVEDLLESENKLRSAQHDVKKDVIIAERNAEEIMKTVEDWLIDTSTILEDVDILKGKIEVNKTCLNGWCPNWSCQYWLGRTATKKTSIMLKLTENSGKFQAVSHPAPIPGIEFSAPKDFQLFKSTEPAFDQIIEALKNDQTHIVGLYGMGGAGKTTLAKAVGNKVSKEIFDEVVMAVISKPPNFRKIQDQLADSLELTFKKESEEGRAKQLYLRFMKTKKILVILDDVWEAFNFQEEIGIPSGNDHKGCKVLLTTRREQVCINMKCQQKIQLNVLNEKEGLALLKKHADIGDDSSTMNVLAIEVARECSGLPLALAAIGGALKGKGSNDWKVISQKLKKSKLEDIPAVAGEKGIYACLKLSYDNLNGEKTKLCFLLCSLFPEDYKIPLNDLVRYGMGLGLYQDADSTEEARNELLSTLNYLKASCLLLDAGAEEFVKMHDMVRDVALWIASKGKNVFMSRTGMGLMEWSNEEGWEQYTAISSMYNKIIELPAGLVCPKLAFLLLHGKYDEDKLTISDGFFKGMKELKVVTLRNVDLSLKSLQLLTHLKTLELLDCNLGDISSLTKLIRLEILSFRGSSFKELPRELSEIRKLRMLDLRLRDQMERIPSNVIQRFSQLEELYINGGFRECEVEETSAETGNARLSELNSLSSLSVLFLRIDAKCLPKDFDFVCRNLVRYDISVNTYSRMLGSSKKGLTINDIEGSSLIAFKALYKTLEYLRLENTTCQNILPSIDQVGLNELKSLELEGCQDLKCIIDISQQQVPITAFSSLVKLSLKRLILLRELWYGPCIRPPSGFLEKLETIHVEECPDMCSLFPALLLQRLHKLKEVRISSCNKLEEVFQLDSVEENIMLLPSLAKLELAKLPLLRFIWKGPTNNVNLQSLTNVEVRECKSLTYLFTSSLAGSLVQLKSLQVSSCENLKHLLMTEKGDNDEREEILSKTNNQIQYPLLSKLESLMIDSCERLEYIFPVSIARGLVQLEKLRIKNAPQLKQVLCSDHGSEENEIVGDGKDMVLINLPKLKELTLKGLANHFRFCPEFYDSTWPALEIFTMDGCSTLSLSFIAKVQDQDEKLRVLCIGSCNQLYKMVVSRLKDGFFKNLEELRINNYGAKVVFEFEGLVTNGQQHILSLPNLKTLRLKYLQELEGLCKIPTQVLSLLNLTTLEISNCNRLRNILSPSLAQNLLQLQVLRIHDCAALEEIIVEEGLCKIPTQVLSLQNLTTLHISNCNRLRNIFSPSLAQNLLQLQVLRIYDCAALEEIIFEDHEEDYSLLFQNLLEIVVVRCPKLRQVFPITIARCLQKLKEIYLYKNFEVEEVFGDKDVADVMDHKEIVLPQLNYLYLTELPGITNFCPVGYHFIYPSLSRVLVVKECPKMNTRFILGQDKSVHAEAKASKIGKVDGSAESPSKPSLEIEWYGYPKLVLPPYIENDEQEEENNKRT